MSNEFTWISTHINLADCCDKGVTLDLPLGSVLVIYTDDGPSGVCGQSMSVTCPHTVLHWFPTEEDYRRLTEEDYRRMANHLGRHGKNARIQVVKIGDWSSGQFSLVKHEPGGLDGPILRKTSKAPRG